MPRTNDTSSSPQFIAIAVIKPITDTIAPVRACFEPLVIPFLVKLFFDVSTLEKIEGNRANILLIC